ncbi:MAG: hypothetical protein R3B69_03705 [Candidatus Paceibacterota bacterium]
MSNWSVCTQAVTKEHQAKQAEIDQQISSLRGSTVSVSYSKNANGANIGYTDPTTGQTVHSDVTVNGLGIVADESVYGDDIAVTVTSVDDTQTSLQQGDRVTSINGQPIASIEDIANTLNELGYADLSVDRTNVNGTRSTVSVTVGDPRARDTVSNQDTIATAETAIEGLAEQMAQLESGLRSRDVSSDVANAVNETFTEALAAIESYREAIKEAGLGNTQAGYDALAKAQGLQETINKATGDHLASIENSPNRESAIAESQIGVNVNANQIAQQVSNVVKAGLNLAQKTTPGRVASIALGILGKIANNPHGVSVKTDPNFNEGGGSNNPFANLPLIGNNVNNKTETNATSTQQAVATVPVIVTIDRDSGTIDFSRGLVIENYPELYGLEGYEDEHDGLPEIRTEFTDSTPLVFNDFGEITYSDGTYAPVILNGDLQDDGYFEYVYFLRTIEDGELLTVERTEAESGIVTEAIRDLFRTTDTYSVDDVVSIKKIPHENSSEGFYDYTVILKNGSTRTITLPEYTSLAQMTEAFAESGFDTHAVELFPFFEEATEADYAANTNYLSKIKNYITDLFNRLTTTEPETGRTVDLLGLSYADAEYYDISDIVSATVYTNIPTLCPNVPGLQHGYIYEVVVLTDEGVRYVQENRCGTGEPLTYAGEIATHLERRYGFTAIDPVLLLEKLIFNIHNPNVEKILETPTTNASSTTDAVIEQPDFVPNLTNTIILESKVTQGNTVLSNWSSNTRVTVPANATLHLRWNGTDYQRCLPFFQDNGTYALTHGDGAMTTGNTESEGFTIPLTTGTYYIECGGQSNGEYGVDVGVVDVTVR